MEKTKKRPDIEIYDTYWKMTAGLTDIYTKEFSDCLRIIIEYIDEKKRKINAWNKKKGKKNKNGYFSGSDLYSNLTNKIIEYMNYTSKSADTSARKVINQYVKIGFVFPFLEGYYPLAKSFISARTNQEKKVLFSKMFYEGASFSSSVTVDNKGFGEVKFLLNSMEYNRYLSKKDIEALMGTDITAIDKGYMTHEELKVRHQELVESGFIARKKIQFGHMASMLNHFVDFKYLKSKKVFTFENDEEIQRILEDETVPATAKRDMVRHRIYKEELKMESEKLYGIQQCYVEKMPYQVLVASHIKACAQCLREHKENQAYDVNNGLLLSPNMDSYFDKHDITFDNEGKILFGKRVNQKVRDQYADFTLDKQVLNKNRLWYLDKHRKVFHKKQRKYA